MSNSSRIQSFVWEYWLFGLKQASACMFGGFLLAMMVITKFVYPDDPWIYRNDLLFLLAVLFQAFLLLFRFESLREAVVIVIFHIVATAMEIFKTSDAIGAWHYPGEFVIGIGNVPLFAGFMYSAVGSYIARVWRLFDFRYTHYPPMWLTYILVALIYANFFTHHFTIDIRLGLLAATLVLYLRCMVYFRIDKVHRRMPLLVGWILVALFIWFAENIATFSEIWLYPSQMEGWKLVPISKLLAWYLLMILSFVLVSVVQRPKPPDDDEQEADKSKV